jgi:hypothetical protein
MDSLNRMRQTDSQRRVDNRIDLVLASTMTTIAGAGFLA